MTTTDEIEAAVAKQPEPMRAWIIEDMGIIDTKRNVIVIGTEADAEAKAAELGFGEDAWVSGPYDFSIAVKP